MEEIDWKNFKTTHRLEITEPGGKKHSFDLNQCEIGVVIASVDFIEAKITKLAIQVNIFDEMLPTDKPETQGTDME